MSDLDKFGKLIAEDLRDSALNRCLDIESSWGSSESIKTLSIALSKLSEDQRALVRNLVTECIDVGVHDFLFALGEKKHGVQIVVNGVEVGSFSDGLQGEPFTEDGWFEKYSQHNEKGI